MKRILLYAAVAAAFVLSVLAPAREAKAQNIASVVYDFSAYPIQSGVNAQFVLDQSAVVGMLQKNADGSFVQDAAGNYAADYGAVRNFVSGLAALYNIPGYTTLNQDVEAQYLSAAITLGSTDGSHAPSVTVGNIDVLKAQEEAARQQALREQQAKEAIEQQQREQAEREAKVKAEQQALKAEQEKAIKAAQDPADEEAEKKAKEKEEEKTEDSLKAGEGQTFIDINITEQKLTYYVNGQAQLVSDIVTGNERAHHDTPQGTYHIYGKQRNRTLRGDDYEAFVKYWMPFVGHYGIHDASWRGSFGGSIYKTNGSHGCVNMPSSTAEALYNSVEIGTTVLIHD